jgi:hypothetical protein
LNEAPGILDDIWLGEQLIICARYYSSVVWLLKQAIRNIIMLMIDSFTWFALGL